MKRLLIWTAVAMLAGTGAVLALDEGEWTGEVLDLGCYERNGSHGEGHADCAVRCLNDGAEMGLLVDGEVVHVDMEASDADAIESMKAWGGKQVKVTGSTSGEGDDLKVTVAAAEPAG